MYFLYYRSTYGLSVSMVSVTLAMLVIISWPHPGQLRVSILRLLSFTVKFVSNAEERKIMAFVATEPVGSNTVLLHSPGRSPSLYSLA